MTNPTPDAVTGLNLQRLYEYRFRDVDQRDRHAVWTEISAYLFEVLGAPKRVLDPAAGLHEFIDTVPADERWAIDAVAHKAASADASVRELVGDAREVELPLDYFDGVLVSNMLEHLGSQDEIADYLARLRTVLRPGGRIAVLGPNFRFCAREYFDCADHVVPLTHVSVSEHLYASGFAVRTSIPRFLPYSFRSRFPASARLVRAYLRMPFAWRLLGKQFLVVAERPVG